MYNQTQFQSASNIELKYYIYLNELAEILYIFYGLFLQHRDKNNNMVSLVFSSRYAREENKRKIGLNRNVMCL